MDQNLAMNFTNPPSAVAYHARALRASPRLDKARGFPAIAAKWSGHRMDTGHLTEFLRLTGLSAGRGLPVLYPQVLAFRLQMAVITHPEFPLPIWGALQVRNHLLLRRPISPWAVVDVETKISGQRILEKGAEADLHTVLHSNGVPAWEGITTFYYRGSFGGSDRPSEMAKGPVVGSTQADAWTTGRGGGRRFAGLTGDYNGIHYWNWYARRYGFSRAFHHPQAVVGKCMARVRDPGEEGPQRLDIWLKGPVYYESDVSLRSSNAPGTTTFALHLAHDERPAVVGKWSGGEEVRDFAGNRVPAYGEIAS